MQSTVKRKQTIKRSQEKLDNLFAEKKTELKAMTSRMNNGEE